VNPHKIVRQKWQEATERFVVQLRRPVSKDEFGVGPGGPEVVYASDVDQDRVARRSYRSRVGVSRTSSLLRFGR
jgi:hypothetical protein